MIGQQLLQALGGPRAIAVNSVMGSLLFGFSDILAQGMEQQQRCDNNNETNNSTTTSILQQTKEALHTNMSLMLHPTSLVSSFADNHDHPSQPPSSQSLPQRFLIDHVRLATAMSMGVLFTSAIYPYAYARLDAWIVGQHWRAVVQKSLLEVATVGILVNSLSLWGRGVMGHHSWTETLEHVREELPRVTWNDARVWIPYNLVAFGCLPLAVRPLTTSCMEAAWQTYISLRSNDYNHDDDDNHQQAAAAALPSASVASLS